MNWFTKKLRKFSESQSTLCKMTQRDKWEIMGTDVIIVTSSVRVTSIKFLIDPQPKDIHFKKQIYIGLTASNSLWKYIENPNQLELNYLHRSLILRISTHKCRLNRRILTHPIAFRASQPSITFYSRRSLQTWLSG